MKIKSFKMNPIRLAVVGAALMTANSMTLAATQEVTKQLDFMCPFPIIGDQLVNANITMEYPDVIELVNGVGVLPPVHVYTVNTVAEKGRVGLSLVDATTVTGTAISFNTFHTSAGPIANNANLVIVDTDISEGEGTFDVPADGPAPEQVFNEDHIGTVELYADSISMDLKNLKANGDVAAAPVGQFETACTLVEGQDTLLVSFEVTGEPLEIIPADIYVNPTSIDFGEIQLGQTTSRTITISNIGGEDLGISSIMTDNSAFLIDHQCGTIEGSQACDVTVTFVASEAITETGTIEIASTDAEDPIVTVSLTGAGELEVFPEIKVTPTSINFGEIEAGTSATETITITNTGGAALTVTALAIEGTEFVGTNNCTTVAPADNCTADVTFTAIEGASTGSVTINSDDPVKPTITASLSGTGIIVNPCVVDPDSCGGPEIIELSLAANGSSYIAANGGTIPLTGVINNEFDLLAGTFTGETLLNPTQGSFEIIKGWKKNLATAHIEFEPVGETVGSLIDGKMIATAQAYVKLPKITTKLFGLFDVKLGGGEECRTTEPVTFTISSADGEFFNPLSGGKVTGTYTMPELENCGALTSTLTKKMKGEGNTIELDLTPIF